MKVAIITLNDDSNIGNRLQNYAVSKLIENKGHEVTTLTFSFNKYPKFSKYWILGIVHDFLLKSGIRNSFFYSKYVKKDKKLFRGLTFTQKYIKTSNKYLYKFKHHKMKKYANAFDKWCVGSDQIWGQGTVQNNPEFFLNFVDSKNTFSIAASFGNTDLSNKYVDNYKDGLNHLGNISVREMDGKVLVKKLVNREATLLLDPTMLLPKKYWDEVATYSNPKIIDKYGSKKFVLTYFLGGWNEAQKKCIERYASDNNCVVVDAESFDDEVGPCEFVWLVKNCKFMFTDSFHGCAFSTIYDKNFLAFDRDSYGFDMSTRITTLLNTIGINECFSKDNNMNYEQFIHIIDKINSIDFSKNDNILKIQQNIGDKFLNLVLGN